MWAMWKLLSCVQLFATPWSISLWNSPGQNTGVGNCSPLQGMFPTQGSNPGLLHCKQILYQLSHQENPRILKWVAYPFSSGSSQPKNRTGVSCITGIFFTIWATREGWKEFGMFQEGVCVVRLMSERKERTRSWRMRSFSLSWKASSRFGAGTFGE